MKEVKNRNEQFERIASIRDAAETIELSIISIDTKKRRKRCWVTSNGMARRCPMAALSLSTMISPHSEMECMFRTAFIMMSLKMWDI